MAYEPYKMKGHALPGINQKSEGDTDLPDGRSGSSPFQYKYPKSPTKQKKTYPKNYTKEDIKFLEEQREDLVRYEDLDKKGQEIWKSQGKPVPKNKKSPTKWVQAVAALAPIAMEMMKKNKEE